MEEVDLKTKLADHLLQQNKTSYLRDFIYGGIDGSVSTFAVVAGVIGAHFSHAVIIVLGFANLLADGFSMGAANYLGTRSEEEEYEFIKAYEESQIDEAPHHEMEEIRVIFKKKGFNKKETEKIVKKITSDEKLWLKTMLKEEYGLPDKIRCPVKAALATIVAFIFCGFVPLVPFIFDAKEEFLYASVATGVIFFIIGAIKSRWSIKSWWMSGLIILAVGAAAAAMAFFVGYFSRELFHLTVVS